MTTAFEKDQSVQIISGKREVEGRETCSWGGNAMAQIRNDVKPKGDKHL